MRRKPPTWLATVFVAGALVVAGGCGSSHNASRDQAIPGAAGGLLTGGRSTTAPAPAPAAAAASRASRQSALERLARACVQKQKVAPGLSVSRNHVICKQLKLVP
jgi:hypothetical protein